MQCNCGADTDATKLVRTPLKARLVFQVCQACGRVSSATLYIRDLHISTDQPGDPVARNQFNNLTKDSAEALYEIASVLQASFDDDALGQDTPPQQGLLF